MTGNEAIAHHEDTLRLWEAIGRERADALRSEDERRRSPRLLVPDKFCRVILEDPGLHRAFDAVVHDVTASGACLLGSDPCAIDRRVCVIPTTDELAPPPVAARVTSCRPHSTGYRIGVEFIEPEDRRDP